MNQPNKLTPVIISSVIIVILSVFPILNFINFICCAGVILGGVAGTFYYANVLKANGERIQFKDGVMIGLLSGFISAIITVLLMTIMSMLVNQNPIPEIYKIFDTYKIPVEPGMEKMLQGISEEYNKKGYSLTMTLAQLGMYLITYPLFAAIGGLLTVSIYNKRSKVIPPPGNE